MKNLGFIPVRGGSKRLPRKNLKKLGDRSITHRAIDAALKAEVFTDIILSTDYEEIIEHCKEYEQNNNIIIDKRDPNLAKDTSTVLEVVNELIERLSKQNKVYDTFTIMLATCPFKQPKHIKEGFELLTDGVDSVISVTEYCFPWEASLLMDENFFTKQAVEPSPLITAKTRSQDRKKVYHPNGAFYIGRWGSIVRDKNFFKGKMRGYIMDELSSKDIDTKLDFEIAEFLIQKGYVC